MQQPCWLLLAAAAMHASYVCQLLLMRSMAYARAACVL
jgi:hypothetical protein